jgi:hypothetical protein
MSISGFDLIGKCFKLGCKDGDARRLEQRLKEADEVIAFYQRHANTERYEVEPGGLLAYGDNRELTATSAKADEYFKKWEGK